MDSYPSSQQPQWSWPRDTGTGASQSGSSSTDRTSGTDPDGAQQQQARPRQRHYKPRTCRICLEAVHPTTEIDDSAAGGLFTSRTRVKYVSEDAELGRLISPCKCKGSQKYVHEGCLRAWRQAAPLSDRNYWRCPTCQFQYRLERLRLGSWLSNWWTRGALTVLIMVVTIFILGFIADPIINFWLDPLGSIAGTIAEVVTDIEAMEPIEADEPATWSNHFIKGLLSLGLLGFVKSFLAMSPWHWFRISGGLGSGRRRGTGRDRLENINWVLIVVGIITFMGATWKLVNHVSTRVLDSASEMVVDIHGDDTDEDEDQNGPSSPEELRKDI